eukprot:jgi/Picre1/27378/NNA_000345.t1
MGLDIERFDKLKRQFPELEEGVVKEALILYDNDFDRARKALQDKYYGDDKAIEQEQSLGPPSLANPKAEQLKRTTDAIGGLGDLIPELLFGPEEEELTKEEMEKFTTRDKKGQWLLEGRRICVVQRSEVLGARKNRFQVQHLLRVLMSWMMRNRMIGQRRID